MYAKLTKAQTPTETDKGRDVTIATDFWKVLKTAGYVIVPKESNVALGITTDQFNVFYWRNLNWSTSVLLLPNQLTASSDYGVWQSTYGAVSFWLFVRLFVMSESFTCAINLASQNPSGLSEKITVMVVTSSADRPQIYSEHVRNLSGFNRTKLKQDGGNPVRLIQDLLQASLCDACFQDRWTKMNHIINLY